MQDLCEGALWSVPCRPVEPRVRPSEPHEGQRVFLDFAFGVPLPSVSRQATSSVTQSPPLLALSTEIEGKGVDKTCMETDRNVTKPASLVQGQVPRVENPL